jgi:hypothetical protein
MRSHSPASQTWRGGSPGRTWGKHRACELERRDRRTMTEGDRAGPGHDVCGELRNTTDSEAIALQEADAGFCTLTRGRLPTVEF